MQVLPTKVPTPSGMGQVQISGFNSTAPSHRQLRGELGENPTLQAQRDYFRFAGHTARASKRGIERYRLIASTSFGVPE